jgi:hypothetical protein
MTNTADKGRRFNPNTIALAMAIYSRSPAAFDAAGKAMILPSKRQLQRYKSKSKSESGSDNIGAYLQMRSEYDRRFPDRAGSPDRVLCEVLFDEIHIRASIHWSSTTHRIIGFEDKAIDFSNIADSIFGNTDDAHVASYANQWMVRTTDNRFCYPLQRYSSRKGASGEELLSQFLQVVSRAGAVNFFVTKLNADAGGGNRSLIS